jgi:ABC-type multidrug transport system ATPase subunit
VAETAQFLQLRDITVQRKRRRMLDAVSLSVPAGQITVLVGADGAGKTTLLRSVLRARPGISGDVSWGERPLRTWSDLAECLLYQAALAVPPPEVSVATLLAASAQAERADPMLAAEVERRLGLSALRSITPAALSASERQRLVFFSAAITRKPFLLLDEPWSAQSAPQRIEMAELLVETARRGSGVLMAARELAGAEAVASHLVLLERGRVVAQGSVDVLRAQSGLGDDASLDQVCLALVRAHSDVAAHVAPQESHVSP